MIRFNFSRGTIRGRYENYHMLNQSGTIGSTDVTLVKGGASLYSHQHSGLLAIAYEARWDFTGRLFDTTRGFPGPNNKIIHYSL